VSYTLVNHGITFNSGTQSSFTCPATTIGNLGVLTLCYANNKTASVTGGGTWTRIGTQNDAGNGQKVDFFYVIFTSSTTTITTSSTDAVTGVIGEWSSTLGWSGSPLRTSDTAKAFANTSTSTDAETSNSITPTSGDLVVAGFGDTGGVQASITQGTGWTIADKELGVAGTGASGLEYQTAAGGSQNATFTVGTGAHSYTVQIAAFAPGGGAAKQQTFFRMFQA
jgi:hypothetical protein